MLGKLIDKILHEDEGEMDKEHHLIQDLKREVKEEVKEEVEEIKEAITRPRQFSLADFFPPLILFLLAFGVRIAFMLLNDPQSPGYGWYGDVYHHWQIAYLSKAIGFKVGFLRLWDLKGMEFFWGLMHPLVLVILMTLTTSVNIIIPRLLSIFCGSMVVVFIYLLVRRNFGRLVAFVIGFWAVFFSVVLFSDALGMQEQLGLFFLFAGLLAWPSWGWLSGLLWAFGSMVRSEYWLFGVGLVVAGLFERRKKTTEKKVLMFIFYSIPIILYMKYMNNHTGNVIFPIYWNYLASFVGEWFSSVGEPLDKVQLLGQWVGRGFFGIGVIGCLVTFWKRPKDYLFYLLGFFNVTFIGFMFGFGAYIHGFFDRFWVDRLLAFPYLFLGIVFLLFFLGWLPNWFKKIKLPFLVVGIALTVAITGASQLAWGHIFKYLKAAQAPYQTELEIAEGIAKQIPEVGKILFPSGRPALTYALVYNHRLDGRRIIGDMYDPYYYAQEGEALSEIEEEMIEWLEREEIGLIIQGGKQEYFDLFKSQASHFKKLGESGNVSLYEFLR